MLLTSFILCKYGESDTNTTISFHRWTFLRPVAPSAKAARSTSSTRSPSTRPARLRSSPKVLLSLYLKRHADALVFLGKRRYDRKQSGFGGQTKPIFRKKVRLVASPLRCTYKTISVIMNRPRLLRRLFFVWNALDASASTSLSSSAASTSNLVVRRRARYGDDIEFEAILTFFCYRVLLPTTNLPVFRFK